MDFISNNKLSLCQSIMNEIDTTLKELHNEWNKIQLPPEEQEQRKNTVHQTVIDVCEKILTNEKKMICELHERILFNKEEIRHISMLLDIPFEDDYVKLSTLKLDKYLIKKKSELEIIVNDRKRIYQDLIEEDKKISALVDEPECSVKEIEIPIEKDLQRLKIHINTMEDLLIQRQQDYKCLRIDIIQFIDQLEKSFNDTFILNIICSTGQDAPPLTKSFLQEIKQLHNDLEFEVKELEATSLQLRENIFSIWSLLNIPSEVKHSFLETVPKHSTSCLSKLTEELDRLKALKKQNLSRLIKELKTELFQWWGKCYIGEEEKEAFNKTKDDVNEESLEHYESEVNRLKNYYDEHSQILNLVDHFLNVFDRMRQLEEKAKDPSRLFNTRGGALLQEERERNSVRGQLPLIQTRLEELGAEFEKEKGFRFRIDGKAVTEYLTHIWKYHAIQKEQEKIKTRKGNELSLPKRSVLKTPTKVSMIRKRAREDDCLVKSSSKRPFTSLNFANSPAPPRASRPPTSLRKVKPLTRQMQANELTAVDDTFNQMSYDKFKVALINDLAPREIFNSTMNDWKPPHLSPSKANKLKLQLNLASPCKLIPKGKQNSAKNTNTPRSYKRNVTSIQGGASGGSFLRRSISQPSLFRPCASKNFLLM